MGIDLLLDRGLLLSLSAFGAAPGTSLPGGPHPVPASDGDLPKWASSWNPLP